MHAKNLDAVCCEKGLDRTQLPANVFVALIHRLAKEASCEPVDPEDESKGVTWTTFLDLLVPWPLTLEDTGEESGLTLESPKVRFLIKAPVELVRLSDRNMAEKLVSFIRSGADGKQSLITLCLDMIKHFQPQPGNSKNPVFKVPLKADQAFLTARDNMIVVANGILALSCHGYPGEYDGCHVKRLTAELKASPQSLTGLVMSALQTSSFWQATPLDSLG